MLLLLSGSRPSTCFDGGSDPVHGQTARLARAFFYAEWGLKEAAMDSGRSIGAILKQSREERGLSVQDVHESTRITVQNLSALEDDRFESFPNKVYARAFLRDYANFLGLDSAILLGRYEEEWGREHDVQPSPASRNGSFGRKLAFSLLGLVVVAGLAVGAYLLWPDHARRQITPGVRVRSRPAGEPNDVARLPRANVPSGAPVVAKPGVPRPEAVKPKPEQPAAPVQPETLTIQVTAIRPVWADVRVDGAKAVYGNLPAGTRKFEAKRKIYIRVGQGNAIQLKEDDKPPVALGTTSNPVTRVFELKRQGPPAAAGAASGAAN